MISRNETMSEIHGAESSDERQDTALAIVEAVEETYWKRRF